MPKLPPKSTNQKWMLPTLTPILSILILSGCGESEPLQTEEKIRPVRTVLASEAPQGLERRFAGTTDSASSTELSFRVSGAIKAFPASVGSALVIGDVIAELDNSDLTLTLEQSKAELAEAQTVFIANKSRYSRLSDLHARQAISAMDYDVIKAEYEASEAKVEQAKRAVELNQQQLNYSKITVPSDGCTLSSALVSVNENISAGQAIGTLNCGNLMEVTSIVPEAVVDSISIGDEIQALIKNDEFNALNATVSEIGLSSSANNLYYVTAQLPDNEGTVRPGMAAELVIEKHFNIVGGNVWVPMVAVNKDQDNHYVMKFVPNQDGTGTVVKTPVTTNRFAQGYFEITEGIELNDRVITAGLSQIYDGLTVKLLGEDIK